MDDMRPQWHPFNFIRVRSLAGWTLLGILAVFLIIFILLKIFGQSSVLIIYVMIVAFTAWPLLWVWRKLRRNNVRLQDLWGSAPRKKHLLTSIALVPPLFLLSSGLTYFLWYIISYLAPDFFDIMRNPAYYRSGASRSAGMIAFSIALIVVIIPIAEEIIFRGIILHRWALKWGIRNGAVFSSLLFGLLHGFNFIPITIFGFMAAIIYIKTKTLWAPIVLHMFYNGATMVFLYVSIAIGGQAGLSIQEFRTGIYLHGAFLILTVPWLVYFMIKNWPQNDWRMPYAPEPPAPPSLPPEALPVEDQIYDDQPGVGLPYIEESLGEP